MTHRLLLLLLSASVAYADFADDGVPQLPDILMRLIEGAEKGNNPLSSYSSKDNSYAYYLRNAEYIGYCKAPFGGVHIARPFFIRSGVRGQKTPPPRGHTFIVFYDDNFTSRARWEVDHDLKVLSTSQSAVLYEGRLLFDFASPPKIRSIALEGNIHEIPKW